MYGDLTPRYISVDLKGYLCLTDFCAEKKIKLIKNKQKAQAITPIFVAPEKVDRSLRFKGSIGKEGD